MHGFITFVGSVVVLIALAAITYAQLVEASKPPPVCIVSDRGA